MLRHLASRSALLTLLLAAGLGAGSALPVPPPFAMIATAHADDDDDAGDDDSDDGGSGGGSASNSDGDDRGSGDTSGRALRGDIRSLLRWPWQQPRRTTQRQAPPAPDHAEDEIVAMGLDETAIARLVANGFAIDGRQTIGLTGTELVRLAVPGGMTLEAARAAVEAEVPDATIDFNHYYKPEQADASPCGDQGCALVRGMIGWPEETPLAAAACAAPSRIGLVDTAINAGHAAFDGQRIEVISLAAEDRPPSGEQHGTAVAALLVGAPGSRAPGLLPHAELVAVDAFQRHRKATDIASAYDLVRAIDMLAARDIRIINLSLTGPENRILERAVAAATERRIILIAAAGNDGPRARPVYPAAYESVIAVTAVDKARRAYRRAVRGEHIDIAAPGVGVWTAASVSGGRQKTGTSFAAPFVAAAASLLMAAQPDLSPQEVAAELGRAADDIGEPGRDAVFGWGLLNVRELCVAPTAP